MFKKGDKVVQVLPAPVAGEVVSFAVDQEAGEVSVLVEWTCAEGHVHSRHFKQSEIQLVESVEG
jgi:hypothetical protein